MHDRASARQVDGAMTNKMLIASVFFIDGKLVVERRSSIDVCVHAEMSPRSIAMSFWKSRCSSVRGRLLRRQSMAELLGSKTQPQQDWLRKCCTANGGLRKRAQRNFMSNGLREKVRYADWADRTKHEQERLFAKAGNAIQRRCGWKKKCNSVRHNMKTRVLDE